jgi:hypothetical protein
MLARILAHGAYLKLGGWIAHLILSAGKAQSPAEPFLGFDETRQQQGDYLFANGKDFAEIVKPRDRNPFVTDEELAICLTEPETAFAIRNLRLWSLRMKITQHKVGMSHHSRDGIFLTDRCSGAFLNHIARAGFLGLVLAVIVVLVTG